MQGLPRARDRDAARDRASESVAHFARRQRRTISSMFRWALSLADRSPGLSILLFHRVLAVADPFRTGDLTAEQFSSIVSSLARNFAVLSLEEGIDRLRRNSLPKSALAITFDDGYRDNLEIAAPILATHGLPATFFIATGFLDGSWMWNDRIIEACRRTNVASACISALGIEALDLGSEAARVTAAHAIIDKAKHLPFDERLAVVVNLEDQLHVQLDHGPMLDPHGLRQLRRQGMAIGAHTVTHPILTKIDDTRARSEINDSRDQLVAILREPIRLFAYPNGRPGRDFVANHVHMVAEAGFESALSTAPLTARPGMDPYELPRFTPWDKTEWRFTTRLAAARIFDARQLPS